MKPTKNRVYCPDCGRVKMLFESESKANTFIKFNKEEIEKDYGYAPCRVYFCQACCGYHVTSDPEKREPGTSRTEKIMTMWNEMKEKSRSSKPQKVKDMRPDQISDEELEEKLKQEFNYLQIKLTPESENIIKELEITKELIDRFEVLYITPVILLDNENKGNSIGKIYDTKRYFIKNYNKSKIKLDIIGVVKFEDIIAFKVSSGLPHCIECTYITISPFPELINLNPFGREWESIKQIRLMGRLEIV